jgi:hypothetical protein
MRLPAGEWICLEATTTIGQIGVTETSLWDERGSHRERASDSVGAVALMPRH